MEYVSLGRKLGIGTRVAAKILRNRARNGASRADTKTTGTAGSSNTTRKQPPAGHAEPRPAKHGPAKQQIDTRVVTRNLTRGVARGGQGFWKSFAGVARALWHEVTGVFFALFALFFIQNTWRVRDAWRSGPEHRHFAIYLVFALVFAYFSVTAFVTSRRHKQ